MSVAVHVISTALLILILATFLHPASAADSHPRCHLEQNKARQRRIQAIKQQILNKLGMLHEPTERASEPDKIPTHVLANYQAAVERNRRRRDLSTQANGEPVDEYFSKRLIEVPVTLQLDAAGAKGLLNVAANDLRSRLAASLPSDIYKAELHFQVQQAGSLFDLDGVIDGQTQSSLRAEILQQLETNKMRYITGKDINLSAGGQWSFDVTSAVRMAVTDSMHASNRSLTLQVALHAVHSADQSAIFDFESVLQSSEVQLAISVHSPTAIAHSKRVHTRVKRGLDHVYCRKLPRNERLCCLKELYVDFRKDLKYDWIVEPKGFFPNYCRGDCPYMYGSETPHSHIMGLYHQVNPAASAQPCCVAKDLDSLTILFYVTVNGVREPRVEELSGMVVTSCKCR